MPHLRPTGSSSGQPPSTTARYFSSCPSDSTSRWTPCPPERYKKVAPEPALAVSGFRLRARLGFVIPAFSPRPARHYPRFRIWHPSSERQRDFNPPEQRAAQRTLRPLLTSVRQRRKLLPGALCSLVVSVVSFARHGRQRSVTPGPCSASRPDWLFTTNSHRHPGQISPNKNMSLRCTTAAFTLPLDFVGFVILC